MVTGEVLINIDQYTCSGLVSLDSRQDEGFQLWFTEGILEKLNPRIISNTLGSNTLGKQLENNPKDEHGDSHVGRFGNHDYLEKNAKIKDLSRWIEMIRFALSLLEEADHWMNRDAQILRGQISDQVLEVLLLSV